MSRDNRSDDERQRDIFCATHGHSLLRDHFFGYHYCARCGAQLGDSLAGIYRDDTAVYVHHMHIATHAPDEFKGFKAKGCHCPENAKNLTKEDFALVPQWNTFGYEQRPPWRKKAEDEA